MKLPGVARVREPRIYGRIVSKTLFIDSNHLDECAALWRKGDYTHLGLESYNDAFKLPNVGFLGDFPAVSRITVTLDHRIDLSGLAQQARSLREILINDEINAVEDLTPLTKLRKLTMTWRRSIEFPARFAELRELALTHFRPDSRDLRSLPAAPHLTSLGLGPARIDSLAGIERYGKLQQVGLYRLSDLQDVGGLRRLKRLRSVDLDLCNGSFSLDRVLRGSRQITHLKYMKSVPLPDIRFVLQLPRLRNFVFLHTQVSDGDMTALTQHRALEYVAFTKKRHFSHSMEKVNRILNERKPRGRRVART